MCDNCVHWLAVRNGFSRVQRKASRRARGRADLRFLTRLLLIASRIGLLRARDGAVLRSHSFRV